MPSDFPERVRLISLALKTSFQFRLRRRPTSRDAFLVAAKSGFHGQTESLDTPSPRKYGPIHLECFLPL
jgi:hypothetical protein